VSADSLRAEGTVFAKYLLGSGPNDYIVRKYVEAHNVNVAFVATTHVDRRLVQFARLGPIATRLADSYARLFVPRSALRRKLSLTFAIIETAPQQHRAVDESVRASFAGSIGRLGIHIATGALVALVAVVIVLPVHLTASIGNSDQ
jgi:hypothetical protein